MMYKIFISFVAIIFISIVVMAEDDHGHDHSNETATVETDNHEGHDHAEHENASESSDENDEFIIELSNDAIQLGGITISTVSHGLIGKTTELPGEVGFNEDRLVHIAPRFAGIAIKAHFRVGDYVNLGEIVAVIESNESMNTYSIKSPISGWIIERHITPGEFVSENNSIFIIADLSTVWVNLAVYPKDENRIKKGQSATITAIGSKNSTTGTIEYITPIIDFKTRAATARITLKNINNSWRPGTFIQASIVTSKGDEQLVVEKDAVQILDELSVIFVVVGSNKFKPVEVIVGDSDEKSIQILGGLTKGTKYVSQGAFEIKAKITTSNLDAHAGHGH